MVFLVSSSRAITRRFRTKINASEPGTVPKRDNHGIGGMQKLKSYNHNQNGASQTKTKGPNLK